MRIKSRVAAIDEWYTYEVEEPHLIGSRCVKCGTYYFPKASNYCRNPLCDSMEFEDVPLSRRGKIWSYTNACYQPPAPFVSPDPFEPFAIAAVELEKEKMIVLGQVIRGVSVDELAVGDPVELVMDVLHEDEDVEKMIWKWKPIKPTLA